MRAARTLLGAALIVVARASAPQDLYDPASLELRAGYLLSVAVPFFRATLFPERGTNNLNLELVLPKIWRTSGRLDALLPRLHLGGTVNADGRTSYAYAGALWTFNYTQRNFAELSFGGLLHDGQLTGTDPRLARLGCRWLYEVGANLGYRLNDRMSLLLSFDHGSNGKPYLSDCPLNEGLNLFGLRLGYRF